MSNDRYYDSALFPVLLKFFVKVALEASSAVSSHLLQRGIESFHLLLCPLPQTQTVKPNKPGAFMNTWSKLKLDKYEGTVVVSWSVYGYRGWQIPCSPSVTDCCKIHFIVRSYGKHQIFYFHENITVFREISNTMAIAILLFFTANNFFFLNTNLQRLWYIFIFLCSDCFHLTELSGA